jgi:hypothetical protein
MPFRASLKRQMTKLKTTGYLIEWVSRERELLHLFGLFRSDLMDASIQQMRQPYRERQVI